MPTSVKTFFDEKVPAVLNTSPEKVKDVAAVYLFKISGPDGGTWTVDLVSSPPTCKPGEHGTPSARSRRATPTSAAWSTAACRRRCRCSSAAS
jgi:hypothetical protein